MPKIWGVSRMTWPGAPPKKKSFEERLLELIQDDEELHEALIDLINAQTAAALELAAWRKRRK